MILPLLFCVVQTATLEQGSCTYFQTLFKAFSWNNSRPLMLIHYLLIWKWSVLLT